MTKRFFDFPETYIYYTLCIYLLQKLKKNVQANFLMGVKFGASWGSPKIFSKSDYWDDFFKNGV